MAHMSTCKPQHFAPRKPSASSVARRAVAAKVAVVGLSVVTAASPVLQPVSAVAAELGNNGAAPAVTAGLNGGNLVTDISQLTVEQAQAQLDQAKQDAATANQNEADAKDAAAQAQANLEAAKTTAAEQQKVAADAKQAAKDKLGAEATDAKAVADAALQTANEAVVAQGEAEDALETANENLSQLPSKHLTLQALL